jgi:hypothetical protein
MTRKSKGASVRTSAHNLKRMTQAKKEKPSKDTLRGAIRPDWEKKKR